ncbi:MAG TPA: YugN family protein [Massilibacterium sp.]|nr:YugN family protein [Massilibacterium sp.]
MRFDGTGIDNKELLFGELEEIMEDAGFTRGGHWDYERVTYDYKYEDTSNGDVYYLRVPGVAVRGEIEQLSAKVKLMTPYLGKHYYPHGVEYDEEFPESLVNSCKKVLSELNEHLSQSK